MAFLSNTQLNTVLTIFAIMFYQLYDIGQQTIFVYALNKHQSSELSMYTTLYYKYEYNDNNKTRR